MERMDYNASLSHSHACNYKLEVRELEMDTNYAQVHEVSLGANVVGHGETPGN